MAKFLSLFVTLVLVSCQSTPHQAARSDQEHLRSLANTDVQGGTVVDDKLVATFSPQQVDQMRDQMGLTDVIPSSHVVLQLHQLTYQTIDQEGHPTKASGMMILPITQDAHTWPVISFQHGTSTARSLAPSNPRYIETVVATVVYAGQGYAVSMPDYLGMGISQQFHPYLHAQSEASASRDMLRATQQAAAADHVTLGDELYLAGYSQGGHATMALHQLLQAENVRVVASFPMAGPFDLSHTTVKGVFTNPTSASSTYVADVLVSMDRVYHVLNRMDDAFVPEVAPAVADLFNGALTVGEIGKRLPATPVQMIQPEFQKQISNEDPKNRLVQALVKNDVYDWNPQAPIYFFHASGDHDVPFTNSKVAYELYQSRHLNAHLTDLGADLSHASAAGGAFVLSLKVIQSLHATHGQHAPSDKDLSQGAQQIHDALMLKAQKGQAK